MSINVLVVDDSMTIRMMVIKALRLSIGDLGQVYEAQDGIDALSKLSEHVVDVILTDINMPKMDGVQFIAKIKTMENVANIPVVVLSTDGGQERLKDLEQLGIRGYLRKPFRPEELKLVLSKILEISYDCQTSGSVGGDF
jgi:two-component system, chemotaxis family, chemotaxis protein CheY